MQDPMSPGQDGLRATNKDGSISRQSIAKPADGGFVELLPRSKATIFAENVRGSGIPAARLDIGPNSMSLDCVLMGTELSLLRQCMLQKMQTLSRLLMDSQSKMPSSFCLLIFLQWICET